MNRRSTLAALGCVALIGWIPQARSAESLETLSARLEVDPGEQVASTVVRLNASFRISLSETLRNAVERGLPLYFVAELQVVRPRWYWTNDSIVQTEVEWRLSYHALTRQYRVASATSSQGYESLPDALASMSQIDDRPVATLGQFRGGQAYQGAVQLRLDVSRLPKPFQMTALTNSEWNPQSEWKRFDFTPPTRKSEP